MSVQSLLADLYAAGLSDNQVATEVQSTQPTIFRLRTGAAADCRYQLGKAIEQLHRKRINRRALSKSL